MVYERRQIRIIWKYSLEMFLRLGRILSIQRSFCDGRLVLGLRMGLVGLWSGTKIIIKIIMIDNKINKLKNLIKKINNDITLQVLSSFLEWFY